MELEPEFGSSQVYDKETKIVLADIFLRQLDFSIELTDAISYVYPACGFRLYDNLKCHTSVEMLADIERCRGSLNSWHQEFKWDQLNRHKT